MEMLRPALGDQPARDRIAGKDPADLDRSFAVEAGAGSGKTSELVRRLVAIAELASTRDETDPLSEVVAISFTRKAAAELRAQAYRGLAERSSQLAKATDAEGIRRHARLRSALARLDTMCVDTIHGFCGRILRADALAVGLPPDYDVLGEKEAIEDRLSFWRRYVARTPDDPLAEVGYDARDVQPLFERLCERQGRLPAPYASARPDLAAAVAHTIERVRELQALRDGRARGVRDPLQRALDRAERLAEYQGVDTPLGGALFLQEVLSGCEARGKKERVWPRRWPDQNRARELLETDLPALAEAISPTVRAWQAYAYDRALAYALDAVDAFAVERIRAGRITQDDVLTLTARLLRSQPRARRRAGDRYRRLLVDEFQDTDPIQAEILFLLAAEDAGDELALADWRASRPRPGSLFLVGDPKQAIYRFRGADIRTYGEARDVLVRSGGETLHLTTCFRSVPALCDWINECLETPFEQDVALPGGERRQARYEPLRSGRDTVGGASVAHVARIDVPAVAGDTAAEIASMDADVIARFIRAAVDGRATPALYGGGARPFGERARYGDFMVLCRAAGRFRKYAAALEAQRVPYALAGDKHLGRADELRALVDLLDAIRDPLDGPVVLGLRTGLLGGFDTRALLGIHRTGLDRATKARVEEWKAFVGEARRALDELPLGAAMERIAQSTGLLSVAAARPEGGSARAGSLLKLLARVREYEALGLHWTEAADRLRELMNGETTDGAITLEEGAADAVRIMTVHQAKGLQAPVVILADPYVAFDPEPSEHTGRSEEGEAFLTVPLTTRGPYGTVRAAPLRWHETDAAEERLYDEAERRRVTYVAATRAESLLVVSRYLGADGELVGEGSWGLLHAGLEGVPALEDLITTAAVGSAVGAKDARLPDYAGRRRAALTTAARPTYAARPVTADDHDDDDRAVLERWDPDGPRAGRGSAFGTAVHDLFRWAIRWRDTDVPPFAERARLDRLWRQLHVQVPEAEGQDALQALRASDLWRRLRTAHEVLTEAPAAGDGVVGAIDLALRDDDGWHLVDFKTDVVVEEAGAAAAAERHAAQLRAYADVWTAASGVAPASLSVYLTDIARCFPVDPAPARPALS